MAKEEAIQLEASLLYCSHCREAMPVRKQLHSIQADGNTFTYTCTTCASPCGEKVEPDDDPDLRTFM